LAQQQVSMPSLDHLVDWDDKWSLPRAPSASKSFDNSAGKFSPAGSVHSEVSALSSSPWSNASVLSEVSTSSRSSSHSNTGLQQRKHPYSARDTESDSPSWSSGCSSSTISPVPSPKTTSRILGAFSQAKGAANHTNSLTWGSPESPLSSPSNNETPGQGHLLNFGGSHKFDIWGNGGGEMVEKSDSSDPTVVLRNTLRVGLTISHETVSCGKSMESKCDVKSKGINSNAVPFVSRSESFKRDTYMQPYEHGSTRQHDKDTVSRSYSHEEEFATYTAQNRNKKGSENLYMASPPTDRSCDSNNNDGISAVPRNYKTVQCKFYKAKQCSRGLNCTFLHGPDEVGLYSDIQSVQNIVPALKKPFKYKQQMCKFYGRGSKNMCRKGASCTYKHSEGDDGTFPVAATGGSKVHPAEVPRTRGGQKASHAIKGPIMLPESEHVAVSQQQLQKLQQLLHYQQMQQIRLQLQQQQQQQLHQQQLQQHLQTQRQLKMQLKIQEQMKQQWQSQLQQELPLDQTSTEIAAFAAAAAAATASAYTMLPSSHANLNPVLTEGRPFSDNTDFRMFSVPVDRHWS